MTVIVLGMHRSGTSVATRLTNLLGPALCRPQDLVRGHGGNERGHWESTPMVAENDHLLGRLASRWWCPPNNLDDVERLASDAHELARARDVFARSHPNSPCVWKDPRTCLLLPFWSRALDSKPVVIHITRDPRDVAQSIHARDGLSVPFAMALWERYVRSAVQGAQGLPVLVTRMDDMLDDPLRWCVVTADFLLANGIDAHVPVDESGVRAFVSTDLCHHRPLEHEDQISTEQAALWAWLQDVVGPWGRFDVSGTLSTETATTAPLFDEARIAFGLVPDGPPPDPQARSFVSLAGISLFEGPSPRRLTTPSTEPRLSVVLVGGTAVNLTSVLPQLRPHLPPDAEIVILDRGDVPVDTAVALGSNTCLVRRRGMLSRAAQLNAGAEVAAGDLLVFIDDADVTPCSGWLHPLRQALEGDVGAVGPAFVPLDGAGDPVFGLKVTDVLFNVAWITASPGPSPFGVASLSLRTLVTTRKAFELVGGFDEGMDGVGGEDVDFCLRLWRYGFRCLAVPSARVMVRFSTQEADSIDRLRNSLRLGLVHLKGEALLAHLAALSAHPSFAAALARVMMGPISRRRTIVESLAWYDLDSIPRFLGVQGLGIIGPAESEASRKGPSSPSSVTTTRAEMLF
jgi:hypothetical protein